MSEIIGYNDRVILDQYGASIGGGDGSRSSRPTCSGSINASNTFWAKHRWCPACRGYELERRWCSICNGHGTIRKTPNVRDHLPGITLNPD